MDTSKRKNKNLRSKSTLGNKLQSNLRFKRMPNLKDEEMFNCVKCFQLFKTKNWVYQKSPIMGYSCKETLCLNCKAKCFKHTPNGR